jgi:hypothetical protein
MEVAPKSADHSVIKNDQYVKNKQIEQIVSPKCVDHSVKCTKNKQIEQKQ